MYELKANYQINYKSVGISGTFVAIGRVEKFGASNKTYLDIIISFFTTHTIQKQ